MQLEFYKYHGAGNDFIMIDNRTKSIYLSSKQIAYLCLKKFGIGADGLILIENDDQSDFTMHYYNADGNIGSMCGNGARCAVAFAKDLGLDLSNGTFRAYDGLHTTEILKDGNIAISMTDVDEVTFLQADWHLDTGSPHYICFVDDVASVDVKMEGARIRYSDRYKKDGVNVNFVELKAGALLLRTYERGVEDETLACGTGATAAAIAAYESGLMRSKAIMVHAVGGVLKVQFEKSNSVYSNVVLSGPAKFVFKGSVDV